jgi:hypothetical protein
VRSNDQTGLAQRLAPAGTNLVALSMVLHLLAVLLLTAVGMIFGLALRGIEDRRPDGGLGSPNAAYTLVVLASTAVLFLPVLAVPSIRRFALGTACVFAAMFGWAAPWLAQAR